MPPRAAAFFDLDRTLLGDSSGFLLIDAFADLGLVSDRQRSLAEIGRRFYRAVGETRIGMELTRRSISRLAGWTVDQLREAASRALDALDDAIYSEARALIERHRAEGRLIVIATSTGREIVEPLARRLGVDHLIASEYEESGGVFTGRLIGKWLWGPDKADAVRRFADEHGIDLEDSYAYSDSFYDRPLLQMVGFPRPVNPDLLLLAYAARRGWPVLRFSNAEAPKMGLDVYDLLRPIAHPWLTPFNLKLSGETSIPRTGPVILAANHRSYADPLVLATVASRMGRKLRFLGKKEVFDAPVIGQLARASKQIRVNRGTGASQPLQEAIDALHHGEAIGIFPQGTIPRGELFFQPKLHGKTGAARLAIATGAPVVPVAIWDTEKLWPRSSRLPLPSIGKRAVHARVGEPLYLKGTEDDVHMLTEELMDAISALLPDEVRNPQPPTPEQIRAATPPNLPKQQ